MEGLRFRFFPYINIENIGLEFLTSDYKIWILKFWSKNISSSSQLVNNAKISDFKKVTNIKNSRLKHQLKFEGKSLSNNLLFDLAL